MTDYGHDLLFGTFLTPSAADPDRVVALARAVERAGLDLVSVQDHPLAPAVRELVEAARDDEFAPPGAARSATPATITEPVWDESLRPAGPMPHSATSTPSGAGRALVDVHDHLRQELDQIFDLVGQVESGQIDIGTARSHINEMTMRQNNWTLGTYCESFCRVVTTHHTIEDASVFPHLRRVEPRLAPVLDRLSEEHHIIHGAIEGVDRALVALVGGGDVKDLRSAVDLLSETLLSHLSYEERQLIEPLGRYGFQ